MLAGSTGLKDQWLPISDNGNGTYSLMVGSTLKTGATTVEIMLADPDGTLGTGLTGQYYTGMQCCSFDDTREAHVRA